MNLLKHATWLLIVALASGCANLSTPESGKDKAYRITIMHTNDHHGRFWKNELGEYGMAARKTIVDRIRKEVAEQGGHTLLLDGGDINTGVPESDMQHAIPDFVGMNLLGYQAMAVGNHEFDKPLSVLKMQQQLIKFPMLSANIYRNGQRMFRPYEIFSLGDVRVGVLGLSTEDTAKLVNPDRIKGIEFRNPQSEAASLLPELRNQADIVIAISHMGHYENGDHGTLAPGDVEMARSVKGIDLIIGGHSQNPACMKAENVRNNDYVPGTACQPDRQNGTWIVQAHEWGKYVGRADFEYRKGTLKLVNYALIPVNLKKPVTAANGKIGYRPYTEEIPEDPDMLALLKPFQAFGQQQLDNTIGSTDAAIAGGRDIVRSRPAAMGKLLGRAMLKKTGADFAMINGGGIRDSLKAGKITRKDVLKVLPFGSTLVTVKLTGREVMDYLDAAAKMTPGSGGFPQFAGIELAIRSGKVESARIKGAPVEPGKTYRLVLNSFQASGADQYPALSGHRHYADTGLVDADVLSEFIAARSPLKASDYAPAGEIIRH
ncbi:5'-nucleotidase / UDP-sugar diphosphatase [Formivibrio citricus]|uniref:5'-nucleotidase / UDP-sugar diphosphatase n=1 Tax=Formivibrio citricus TaxID=83765 RepID=A0A1I4VWV2_9NEIS|nr:bifunctional UDP-sugar hydrolase/5'-nucleotidase UshA [Formivibrio citricus]SFN05695.1 5'-nucleotidase / UDP-sugar diphosphatase [Formivibrio citricus]